MTIALGMLCRDGVVIAADSEISAEGYDKTYASKVCHTSGADWGLLFGYADDPGLDKEAREKILRKLRDRELTPEAVRAACEEVFTEIGMHQHGGAGLQMLIGLSCPATETRLLVFDGGSISWEHGIHALGVGDCSLTSYLSKVLYDPLITTEQGKRIAVYIVAQAKRYVSGCSGPTTVVQLRDGGELIGTLSEEILQIESEMAAREQDSIRQVVGH